MLASLPNIPIQLVHDGAEASGHILQSEKINDRGQRAQNPHPSLQLFPSVLMGTKVCMNSRGFKDTGSD